jgi:hypothetical protein
MAADPNTIQGVIATFRQAADANLKTSARCGNLVHLTADHGSDVLISGDLHGHRLNFDRLQAIADLAAESARHWIVQEVCHGGPEYPGRGGCMSHLLLEDVADLKTRFPQRFHFLLGNHELSELTDFLIAKGGQMLNLQFQAGLKTLYGDAAVDVREAARAFLRTCPLAARVDQGVFVSHGSPDCRDSEGWNKKILTRPLTAADSAVGGDAFRLLWGRDFDQPNADRLAKHLEADVLIHGHEPCSGGFAVPNSRQIILDSCGMNGCYLLLPIGKRWTQAELVSRVRQIYAAPEPVA